MACDGFPAQARRSSGRVIFREDNFTYFLNNPSRAIQYYYAYLCHQYLGTLERSMAEDKEDIYGTVNYGQALRYGKYALTSVVARKFFIDSESLSNVEAHVSNVIDRWLGFENYVTNKNENYQYFSTFEDEDSEYTIREYNYDGYYKGRTLNDDLVEFFQLT